MRHGSDRVHPTRVLIGIGGRGGSLLIRRPLLAGDRASETHCKSDEFLPILQTQKARRGPRLCRRPLRPKTSFHTSASFFCFFSFLAPLKRSSKIGPLSHPPKVSKFGPLGTQSYILEPFWMTFGITFSINFPDRLNLVICKKYNAKTYFDNFRTLMLVSKFDQQK